MSASTQSETFPLEIWLRILDYSSTGVHRSMSQLSSVFRRITRKRLYHTLVFGDQGYLGFMKDTAYDGTWCRDYEFFHELHKDRDDWKPHVHRVFVQCLNDEVTNDEIFETRCEETLHNLGLLFDDPSLCTSLEFFHTTIPYMEDTDFDTDLPICGVTSMSLAMEDDGGPDNDWLPRVCKIVQKTSTLRFLELREWHMTDYDDWLDEHFFKSGTWSTTHLSFLECGPVVEDMLQVLRMPKDLQSLKIASHLTPDYPRNGMDAPISIEHALETLAPVRNNLVELDLDPGPTEHWVHPGLGIRQFPQPMEPCQTDAFTLYPKLRCLTIPLEMVSQSAGKMSRRDNHTFYTNFPPSLEKLTLVVTSKEPFNKTLEQSYALPNNKVVMEDRIVDLSDLSCQAHTYEKAHELFEELAQLVDHRDQVPALRQVLLLRDPCQWLDCECVKQRTRRLLHVGIAVHVHDRAIEGPTQSSWMRVLE